MEEMKHQTKNVRINGQNLHSIRSTDDIALVAERPEEMNKMLNTLSNILNNYQLKVNAKKTKTMTVGNQHLMKSKSN